MAMRTLLFSRRRRLGAALDRTSSSSSSPPPPPESLSASASSGRFPHVCVVAARRTPIGSFQGSLASLSATSLGSIAIEDLVVLSSGGPSNAHCISAVRLVPASQLSLLWRTPWTCATFGRAYASAAESRKREIRVSDEVDDDNDGDAGESSEFEDDSDVEDEQRIEDSDDDEVEEDQDPQNQGPAKKKIKTKPPKSKLPDQQGRSLNEQITARTLRLVTDDGQSHRILSRDEALTLAKGKKLDLVLVDGTANPPVCKIYDFNKEEYKQEQLLKERKKQKGAVGRLNEIKELRFNSKIEPKDLKMKVEKAKEFMNRGHRVKFVSIFKGKSDDEKKRIEEEKMIDSIYRMVEDVATIEQGPRVESRQAWMLLRHVKFTKKKPPKPKPQISPAEQVGSLKQEDQVHAEPDFYQGQEENIMQAQKHSSILETAAMGGLQGYPSKLAASSTQPFTFGSPHPQVQPAPSQGTVEAFSSQMHSLPLHGFPQHTQSLQGFGASQGSERAVSPPRGPLPSIPALQRGVQGAKIQSSRPSVAPQPASSLQGFEEAQLQSSPLDGMLPPQSEQHSSHTPKIQMFSMPSQSRGILSQKQSPNDAPRPQKAIGSDIPQGQYPATARGRGISPPNQPPHSLYSPTPSTSLRGPPSNLRGSLLNLSQSPPVPPVTQTGGPSNLQSPLPNTSPSTSVPSSDQGSSSNLESPLADFFSSPPPSIPQRAPSSFQGSHLDPSRFVPSQNVQERNSPPMQGSEGLPLRGVPRYPPPPSQGIDGFPPPGVPRYPPPLQGIDGFSPQGVSRYPPPPIGQPRYTSPLGQPSLVDLQSPQGEFAPGNQNRQLQGPDFTHQIRSQPQPALDAAAPGISQQQNYRPEQGLDRYAPLPNLFGSSQHTQQRPPNLFGSSQRPQQGPPNFYGSPQRPQEGPPNLFRSPQTPQQGSPNFFGSPRGPQQGPPNLVGSAQGPQQGPPNLFGSPLQQQGPPNLFGSPLRPQQGPSNLFGSPQQGPPEPSQIQFGYQPVGVPQGPRQGGPQFSQQAPSRDPFSRPSHPQQTGQPPSQGHQGYFAQQEAQGGGQNYWQSQALQGYPPQQNQAPQGYPPQQNQAAQGYPPQQHQASQGYPPQRGFPQTRLAQGGFGFQGNHPQNQASQESLPPRGLPVVPSRPGFRPSWSTPPQSQEYSPLFESPSDKPGA